MGFKENEGVGNYVELQECMWDMHKALTVPDWLSLRVCTWKQGFKYYLKRKSVLQQNKESLDRWQRGV